VPTPLLVLFYLWLAASIVILVYRFVGRRRTKGPKPVRAADLTPTATPAVTPAVTPTVTPAPEPKPTQSAPPPSAPPPAAAATPPSSAPPAPASAPPSAPTPEPTPPAGGVGRPAASLMEALAGITLPCDLLPMTTVEGRTLSPRELLLVTSGYSGAEVGRALGAAVAELGYAITPLGGTRALAARGADQITITIHDRPDTILAGKRQAFPTAGADSVVVELRL